MADRQRVEDTRLIPSGRFFAWIFMVIGLISLGVWIWKHTENRKEAGQERNLQAWQEEQEQVRCKRQYRKAQTEGAHLQEVLEKLRAECEKLEQRQKEEQARLEQLEEECRAKQEADAALKEKAKEEQDRLQNLSEKLKEDYMARFRSPVGKIMELELENGDKVKGFVRKVDNESVEIRVGEKIALFTRAELAPQTCVRIFASDYAACMAEAGAKNLEKAGALDADPSTLVGAGMTNFWKGRNAEAVKFFRMAADLGDSWGQYNLALCRLYGLGCPQDINEALTWYRASAEQGNPKAQTALGLCYYQGVGVNRSVRTAERYFRQAAAQGDARAETLLAALLGEKENAGARAPAPRQGGAQAAAKPSTRPVLRGGPQNIRRIGQGSDRVREIGQPSSKVRQIGQ